MIQFNLINKLKQLFAKPPHYKKYVPKTRERYFRVTHDVTVLVLTVGSCTAVGVSILNKGHKYDQEKERTFCKKMAMATISKLAELK